jgi:hypothetical protein
MQSENRWPRKRGRAIIFLFKLNQVSNNSDLQLKRASFHDALAMIQQVCLGDEVSAKNETLVPPTKQNGTE